MENSLYLMLLAFTYSLTILSFVIPKNIPVRLFSSMLLFMSSFVGFQSFMYIGFGNLNVLTWITSQAGDPGRGGELEVLWMYGLMGLLQMYFVLVLCVELVTGYLQKQKKGRITEGMLKEFDQQG